jgi:hypothetical protein
VTGRVRPGFVITGGAVCMKAVTRGQDARRPHADRLGAYGPAAPATILPAVGGAGHRRTARCLGPLPATARPRHRRRPRHRLRPAAPTSSPQPVADVLDGGSDKKVTICHATSSESNPYVLETIIRASSAGNTGHTSKPFLPAVSWGDVIPPTDDFPGMNCPAGAALIDAGCAVPPSSTRRHPTPTPTPVQAPRTRSSP